MSKTLKIDLLEITPSVASILSLQGVPEDSDIRPQILDDAKRAIGLFENLADPLAVYSEIKPGKFESIYQGIGLNSDPNPIEKVYKRSRSMALFAATSGPKVTRKISELFAEGEFSLGNMLDSAASCGTDLMTPIIESSFQYDLFRTGRFDDGDVVLAYSPGYCGWHISAQKELFEYLHPEEIGITLRDSFLMEPLKSISGVLLAGPRKIHVFETTYPFCADCKSRTCQERINRFKAARPNR